MNFRTTILLLVVLVAAAVVYFATSGRDSNEEAVDRSDATNGEAGKRLVDVPAADVNRVSVTPAGGERLAFERVGTSEWRLTEPVKGPADAFKVDELVRQVTDLRSGGQVSAEGRGVDQPRYVVEVTTKDNRTTKLNVGNRSPVGDTLYVRLDGEEKADVVSSSVVAQLAKEAGTYRKTRIVNVPTDKVSAITIAQADKTLRLERSPDDDKWRIVEPAKMPADAGQVSSLISSVNSLDATRFVDETAGSAGLYGLSKPSLTVTLGTAPPETQPTTGPAAATRPAAAGETTTVKFGRTDVEKTNVYAMASESGPVVTVPAASLDAFRKTPLDLRDREVVDINPDAVSRVSITKEAAPATTQPSATQAATKPAMSKTVLVLERRSEVGPVGPPAPTPAATRPATPAPATQASAAATTAPTTAPTTIPAATQPDEPPTKWLVTSDPKSDGDDAKVQTLLNAFGPLRAEKYLERFPTTQAVPAAVYTLKFATRSWADEPAREHELKITDPGNNAALVAQLGELTFELNRSILSSLNADFTHRPDAAGTSPAGPASPSFPGLPGFPGAGVPDNGSE